MQHTIMPRRFKRPCGGGFLLLPVPRPRPWLSPVDKHGMEDYQGKRQKLACWNVDTPQAPTRKNVTGCVGSLNESTRNTSTVWLLGPRRSFLVAGTNEFVGKLRWPGFPQSHIRMSSQHFWLVVMKDTTELFCFRKFCGGIVSVQKNYLAIG